MKQIIACIVLISEITVIMYYRRKTVKKMFYTIPILLTEN